MTTQTATQIFDCSTQRVNGTKTVICAWCKKILKWGDNATKDFLLHTCSHDICKPCAKEYFPEQYKEEEK